MRLVSFGPRGEERAGLLLGEEVLDLAKADAALLASVLDLLEAGEAALARCRELAASPPAGALLERASVRLGAPVPRPGKILCLGANYIDHAKEADKFPPERPLVFSKTVNAACGPEDDVPYPEGVAQLDYEVELAVVIGRRAKGFTSEEAKEIIAGYMVFDDVSARCAQFGDGQWFRGKSFDNFAPMGPALVTPEEVPDWRALRLTTRVNGEPRQDARAGEMTFDPFVTLAHLGRGMTLEPGDVLATGTPAGVGVFREPQALLAPGDLVECEVATLGVLRNRIVGEPGA